MDLALERRDHGWAVLVLNGRLDLVSAAKLRQAVDDTVNHGTNRVIVDLSGVPFMDSSGLGALVGAFKRATGAGGAFRIAGPSHQVRDVISIMRLDQLLPPYLNVDAALEGP